MLELKQERADLGEIIRPRRREQPAVPRAPEAQISRIEIDRPRSRRYVDSTRVAQILGNLLHNAAKFTPAGGRVASSYRSSNDEATIRVVDSGEGLAADELERVFEMFSQSSAPARRSERGLGIGLALARQLAEMHGGTLTAASDGIGHGTAFTLRLPIVAASEAAASHHSAEKSGGNATSAVRVVVIEDNDDNAAALSMWLESMGHHVWVGRTGCRRGRDVRDHRPSSCSAISGCPMCMAPRSVVASAASTWHTTGDGRDHGLGAENDRRQTAEAGFDHHFVKPVKAENLRKVLRSLTS